MAGEKYIERLQRERKELIDFALAVKAHDAALYHASVTGRKGTAYQEVDRVAKIREEMFHIIEPYLAE